MTQSRESTARAEGARPEPGPEDVVATYEAAAEDYAEARDRSLFERRWLDRMMSAAPSRRRVLDLGCGTGRPIATYLTERGASVTGVDTSRALLAHFQRNLPDAAAYHLDMREMELGESFDAILAWNSFFHLGAEAQRKMFATFRAHAAPSAALMFTSGDRAGIAIGEAAGHPVFHESLDPEEYRELMERAGFRVIDFVPEDPSCNGHTVWLARRDARLD